MKFKKMRHFTVFPYKSRATVPTLKKLQEKKSV